MVRLAGEKMAKHFIAVVARNPLRSVDPSQLLSFSLSERDELFMVDDGAQSQSWTDYTISLRSSCLTLCRDKEYIVEPYSPPRFSRQFNFCQDVPGKLAEEASPTRCCTTLAILHEARHQGRTKNPNRSSKSLVTKRHQEWWAKHASDFVKGNIEPTVKEGEAQALRQNSHKEDQ